MEQFLALLPDGKTVSGLEDLSSLRVVDLKKNLKAFKSNLSGVKADLILRAYAVYCRLSTTSPIDSDAPVDADVDMNAFTYSFIRNEANVLPWSKDLKNTPAFTFVQLYDYLFIRTVKYKHILLKNTSYKKLKAFKFFYEGFVKSIEVACSKNFCFIDARIKASMKSKLYKVILKLSADGNVCSAACTCPAGIGIFGFGNCNHVGGVLFGLEDYNRRGIRELPSCTSKLSVWNVPRNSSSAPVPIDQVLIKKISFGQDVSKDSQPKINLYDPRVESDHSTNIDRLEALKLKLSSSLPQSCFFLFHNMNPYPEQGISQVSEEEVITMDSTPLLSLQVLGFLRISDSIK